METMLVIVVWQYILLLASSIPLSRSNPVQPDLSLPQTKQNKRKTRSPETFENIFNPSETHDVSSFINSHGSPLMLRSNAGLNTDNITPLLRHATDQELRLLHQQAKELRRQSLEEHKSEVDTQLNGQSFFQEVNLQSFNSNPTEPSFLLSQFKSDQRTDILMDQGNARNPAVFSSLGIDAVFKKPINLNSRVLEVKEKPRIHFPSKKLKAEVPAIDLNSDLKTSIPSSEKDFQRGSRLAFELFLKARDSSSLVSEVPFIPFTALDSPQPIFSPRDTFDRIPSQIADNSGRPSEETITLFDSIQKRINVKTEQKKINNLHIEEKNRDSPFPNFQRSDPLATETIIQPKTHQTNSKISEERERNIKILQAIAGATSTTRRPSIVRVDTDRENTEEEMRRKQVGEKRRKKLFNIERRRLLDNKRRRLTRTTARPRNTTKNSGRKTNSRHKTVSSKEEESQISQDTIVNNAVKAILDRAATGRVKDSPVVWAAIKTIYEFIEAQEKAEVNELVPQEILMSIMQLTGFLENGGKMEKEESMESFNVETVNAFVREKARHIERPKTITRPTTPSRPTARTQVTTILPSRSSDRVEPERRQPLAREPFDIYTDEAITANDYDFDYEIAQDVQFKFRFKPSSKIQIKQEGNQNQPSFTPRSFIDRIRATTTPSLRDQLNGRKLSSQQTVRPCLKATEKPFGPTSNAANDERFKLNFDPKSGLFSTSVDQFQIQEKKPTSEQIQQIKRPRFEIFTLPI